MTDRLDEIRARRALYGHEIVRPVVLMQDIEYLLAEVERLRAALGRIGIHATGCGMQFGHPCEFGCITVNFWTYATSALTEGGEL